MVKIISLDKSLPTSEHYIIEERNLSKWMFRGNLHRVDGPAVVYKDGTVEWAFVGIKMTFNEWLSVTIISDEEKLMLKLKYA